MITLLLAFAVFAVPVSAQRPEALALQAGGFEFLVGPVVAAIAPADAFAGVAECASLDVKTFRPFTLDEASDMAAPCLAAVGRKLSASVEIEAGFLAAAHGGRPARTGLVIKTDLAAGSKGHRDLMSALSRRENRILGHVVRLLTPGEPALDSVSSVQAAMSQCIMTTVVRDIQTGADFVKIYGRCLSGNPDLKIKDIRAGQGLSVDVKTAHTAAEQVNALNGFVVVNAGKGPVRIRIVASAESLP